MVSHGCHGFLWGIQQAPWKSLFLGFVTDEILCSDLTTAFRIPDILIGITFLFLTSEHLEKVWRILVIVQGDGLFFSPWNVPLGQSFRYPQDNIFGFSTPLTSLSSKSLNRKLGKKW